MYRGLRELTERPFSDPRVWATPRAARRTARRRPDGFRQCPFTPDFALNMKPVSKHSLAPLLVALVGFAAHVRLAVAADQAPAAKARFPTRTTPAVGCGRIFPKLFFIVTPGGDYGTATWTGINSVIDGIDNITINNKWLAKHIQQGHGPLGAATRMLPGVWTLHFILKVTSRAPRNDWTALWTRRMGYVQAETRRGWGLGGSPKGDRRGLSLADARGTGRWSSRRKVSVVLELLKGADLESLSRRHGVTAAKLSAMA